jgi:CheY-like chemotaxis protein
MGGRIQAESAPGAGSTFTVDLDLPIAESSSSAKELQESAADCSVLKGRRVLLAEDNEINAEITGMMLEEVGIAMDVAKDGNLAVKVFSEAPEGYYYLILMDNRMPGKTGTEAAREIRKLPVPGAATIPIIALTADAFDDDHQKFMEAGMNDCLTKPLDQKKLIEMLMKYC